MQRSISFCRQLVLALMTLGFAGLLQAQAVAPDAGALRQQIEQQRQLQLPQAVREPRAVPPPEIKPRAGLSVTVRAFRFAGNALLGEPALAAAVAGFVGRPLSFEELQRATDAVAAAYREAGWLARVYLPEQEISGGEVLIQVVEARFGGLRFEGEPSRRVLPEVVERYFTARQRLDEPLDAAALDRALLLVNDLPGLSAAGTLAAGPQEGQTALVLQTADQAFISGAVGMDNTGARATGAERVTAELNVNSPGLRGELANLSLLHSRGSDYARGSLTLPVGHDGLRLGVNASSMTYKVVKGPAASSAAQINGRSSAMGLEANYPLQRARLQNVYLSAGLDRKHFVNRDTETRSDYASNSARLGLWANRFDEVLGGGASSASLQLQWGRLNDMVAHTRLGSIDRSYRKLSYSLTRQQTLSTRHSLFIALSGQHATRSLDSSEKFYVGGPGTVRAYPVSELGGERAQVLGAEWRWRVRPTLVASAFYDVGRVVSLPATASDQRSTAVLRGAGVGVAWQGPAGLSAKLNLSHRIGHNPRPTPAGTDSDGSLVKNRVWLSVTLPF